MTALRRRMIEDMRIRNFSSHTQQAYIRYVARFAKHFGRSLEELGIEHVRQYLVYLVQVAGAKPGVQSAVVAALRFLYFSVLPASVHDAPGCTRYPREPGTSSKEAGSWDDDESGRRFRH